MAQDHSFDIVSKPNMQELDNALQMAAKELATRFDFKGSVSSIDKEGEDKINLVSEDEFKLKNVVGILQDKFARRQLSIKFFEFGKIESALGGTVKQVVKIKNGIEQEVQTQIQGETIRVTAKKIDDLQAVMQKVNAANLPIALQFTNYR